MTTNLSKYSCSFSDFPWEEGSAILPTSKEFFNYLRRYTEHFKVIEHIRYNCNVEAIKKVTESEAIKYQITWTQEGEKKQ